MRNLLFTLRDKRNEWAHNRAIKPHDAQFVLSGILTVLETIYARETEQVRLSLDELNRTLFERERKEREASGGEASGSNVVDAPKAGLRPWRDVISPHSDVATGRFAVAEFAADLELVRKGEGAAEYGDPRLFFERTYLTAGLRELLTLGVKRVAGQGGQPVINCQTNFGGGKTHSLIALFHLLSGVDLDALPDEVQELVASAEVDELPTVRRAVVVGNRFAAGETHEKPDGTIVHTIWGEIAWQLGGAEGYAKVADSDRNRTNPGDLIREVLAEAAPCLVLIDEWVAYARELYGRDDIPGGSFDSQFGFAQALTEAARAVEGALFVVSIPA
ncbi:AAA+ family ATPase, partial [cyanobacterium TDX16]